MFLPFPLIHAFYDDLSVALLFSLPIMIVHNTIGVFLASYWGHGEVGRRILVCAVTFPPLVVFFLGSNIKTDTHRVCFQLCIRHVGQLGVVDCLSELGFCWSGHSVIKGFAVFVSQSHRWIHHDESTVGITHAYVNFDSGL